CRSQSAPAIDDGVPQLLALGAELLTPHIGNPAHSRTIITTRSPAYTRPAVNSAVNPARHDARSRVPAVQQRPSDPVHEDHDQAQHAEASPGLQGMRGVVHAGELLPRLSRPDLGDRVPPRV